MEIDYNEAKQKLIVDILLSNEEIFARFQNILSAKYFVNKLRPAVRYILKYASEYHVLPKIEMVNAETGLEFKMIDGILSQHAQSFLDEIEEFCKNRALADAVLSSTDLIAKGNYGEVEKRVREAILISLQSDLGTNYFEDPKARLEAIRSRNGQMSTGWKAVDEKLYGGVNRGELTIWAGASGCVNMNTLVEVIELPILSKNDLNHLSEDDISDLWLRVQPKKIPIHEIKDRWNTSIFKANSPDGFVPVVDLIEKNKIAMFELSTQTKSIICSYDHLIQLSNQNWIYANDVKIGQSVITDVGDQIITGKKQLPGERTYDLEIGHENRRYYTNGICSHNTGKSLVLQNISLNLVKQGFNVVYITLELSEGLTSMRMDSMLSNIGTRDIFKKLDEVEIKVKQAGFKSGSFYVKQLPQGSTTNDIKVYLKNYEIETGKKPDVLVVDYLDLIYPNNKRINIENLFTKDKMVTEELRGLCVEMNMNGQSASQLGRSSINEQEHDQSMIAGGISKINTADNVISIYVTQAMKERGQYQFQFLKTRSSSGVGSKVFLAFDPASLVMSDMADDMEVQPSASEVFNDLRRRNNAAKEIKPIEVTSVKTPARDLKSLTDLIKRK